MKGDLNELLSKKMRTMPFADDRITEDILLDAAPIIEARLGDPRYLKQWTWNGKQAFYDDEPGGVKETRGGFMSRGYGNHLKNQFHVRSSVSKGIWQGIELTNDKEVRSSKGKFNLFELLWHGFGPYNAGEPRWEREWKSMTELNQMNWKQRRSWEQGKLVYAERPMNFYYRYASRWFYKKTKREGFTPSLHSKFKQYIMGAVEYGIQMSIKNMIERKGDEVMRNWL